MRTREIWLLLLLVAIALTYRDGVIAAVSDVAPAARVVDVRADAGPGGEWSYDPRSRYYSFLPADVQSFRSPVPLEAANRVCRSFGGTVDILQEPRVTRETIGFNCSFQEPDVTITAEFGDLRRTHPRNK